VVSEKVFLRKQVRLHNQTHTLVKKSSEKERGRGEKKHSNIVKKNLAEIRSWVHMGGKNLLVKGKAEKSPDVFHESEGGTETNIGKIAWAKSGG